MERKGLKEVAMVMLILAVLGTPVITTHAKESCIGKCIEDCGGEGFPQVVTNLTCMEDCEADCSLSTIDGDKFDNVTVHGGYCLDHCREGCQKQHSDETYSDCESNCPLQCFMQIPKSKIADYKLYCSKCMKYKNIGDKKEKDCTDQSPQCMKLMNGHQEKIDECTDLSPKCMNLTNADRDQIEGCTDLFPQCMNLMNAGKDQLDECADSCWKSCLAKGGYY